jgi:hypothetical protein
LTPAERKQQYLKKKAIGKYNYSLSFLDLEDDYKEWDEYQKKKQSGELPNTLHR